MATVAVQVATAARRAPPPAATRPSDSLGWPDGPRGTLAVLGSPFCFSRGRSSPAPGQGSLLETSLHSSRGRRALVNFTPIQNWRLQITTGFHSCWHFFDLTYIVNFCGFTVSLTLLDALGECFEPGVGLLETAWLAVVIRFWIPTATLKNTHAHLNGMVAAKK